MKEVFLVYLSEIFGSRSFSVKLPLSKDELSAKIKKEFKEREYVIEVMDNHGLYLNEFTNIQLLNEFAQLIVDKEIDEKTLECIAEAGQNSLEDVKTIIENGTYSIIDSNDNFSDIEKDLGYALHSNKLLNFDLPEELVSKGYIDFEAIGRDAMISFGWEYVSQHKSFCRTW